MEIKYQKHNISSYKILFNCCPQSFLMDFQFPIDVVGFFFIAVVRVVK